MKKEFRSALEVLSSEQMSHARLKRLPKDEGYLVFRGEIVYMDLTRPGLAAFTSFIPNEKRNAFTVELGWSADGGFPSVKARPSTTPEKAIAGGATSGSVRLTELYSRHGEDWDVAPIDARDPASFQRFMDLEMRKPDAAEALSLLRPLMEDGAKKWRAHACRFFDKLSSRSENAG